MLCTNPTGQQTTHILALFLSTIVLASCSAGDSSNSSSSSTPPIAGTTVQVSVTANDPDGNQLHYRWAATDGFINNIDAAKTTWVVPKGLGMQFAYVVVSDSNGSYIESRAAALSVDPPIVTSTTAPTPTPLPTGQPGFIWGSVYSGSFGRHVYLPGVTVTLYDGPSAVATAITDMKGQFFISDVEDKTYTVKYRIPGQQEATLVSQKIVSNNNLPTSPRSGAYLHGQVNLNLSETLQVAGSVRMKDLSYCGMRNEFFTDPKDKNDPTRDRNLFSGPVSGSAQLLDANNNPLSESFPINHYGDFLIVRSPISPNTTGAKVRVTCEGAVANAAVNIPSSGVGTAKLIDRVLLNNHSPIITKMSVQHNGNEIGRPDLPKPRTLFTSVDGTTPRFGTTEEAKELIADIIRSPGDDAFFTFKGIDTRMSACAYYRAIGAVQDCDSRGFPIGTQLTLAQWRSKFNLSPFPNGNLSNRPAADGQEVRVQYINISDLNLGRDMQAIKLENGDIAYNTCNYAGPMDVTDPLGAPKEILEIGKEAQAQNDINRSIQNIHDGDSMIVCVAMDNSAIPGINGSQRFTKFYTFGPTGQLLLSVSLDGRREKFMPGSCTACHGGNAYGGQFPYVAVNGKLQKTGAPDIQSNWQPFDLANIRFSSTQDLQAAKTVIKELNRRMNLASLTTPRTRELIGVDGVTGWYKAGGVDQDSSFIPSQIQSADRPFYQSIIQPACQTCHAAQGSTTIDVPENLGDTQKICGGNPSLIQNHTMPNALVPFERFWLANGLPSLCASGIQRHPPL